MRDLKAEKSYAASLCSRTEKCSFDIKNKLLKRGFISEDQIEEILVFLKKENFLDDKRFAESYTLDKFKFNKWGKIQIRMHLKQKEIDEKIIQQSLEKINEQEYLLVLEKLIKAKSKVTKAEDEYQKKIKIARFAASKGFEQDKIFTILNLYF